MIAFASWSNLWRCVAIAFMIGMAAVGFGQTTQIAHFVSPLYPPLARQAGISGRVTLNVKVDKNGSVTSASQNGGAHPLLLEWAKDCVAQWKFQPTDQESDVVVEFIYTFSSETRETNPKTTVIVDFQKLSIRVAVTTDAARNTHP